MKILTVLGSLQRRSSNRALLELAEASAPAGVMLARASSTDRLPHYNADLDVDPTPETVRAWRSELLAADAVLFASPEYGHGMPGSLKNALDWIVGTGELSGKPVAATCAGQGPGRGQLGVASLVATLRAVDALVVWSEPLVVPRATLDPDGRLTAEPIGLRALLAALVGAARSPRTP